MLLSGSAGGDDSGTSSEDPEVYGDKYMTFRYDLLFSLHASQLPNFLNYTGSALYPVTKVAVNYRHTTRSRQDIETGAHQYEDLWYHEGAPVGCRRFNQLLDVEGANGAIRVAADEAAFDNPGAVANAVVRLFLDANLKGAMCTTVIVPQSAFQTMVTGLSSMGFYEVTSVPEAPIPGCLVFTLVSDPPGLSKEMFYAMSRYSQ